MPTSYGAYTYKEEGAPAAFTATAAPTVDFPDTTNFVRMRAVAADVEVSYDGATVHAKILSGTTQDFPGLTVGKLWARSAAGAGTLVVTAW